MALESASGKDDKHVPDLLEELASGVPGVLFSYWVSADGTQRRFPYISSRVSDLFDVTPEELGQDGLLLTELVHPDDVEGLRPSTDESARTLQPWQYQARVRLKDGSYQWFEGHSLPKRLADGSTLWFGQFTNIQAHKDLELSLRASEAETDYQLRFHQLLASLSSEFMDSAIGDIDAEINHFLARIGNFFQLDRAYIYQFSDDLTHMTNTHEWCRDGVTALKDSQQDVDITGFHWWQQQIRDVLGRNQVVFVEDVSRLPETAVEERALLEEEEVAAMFCAPLQVRGVVEGFFGMDSLTVRHWRGDLDDLLVLVANMLAQAVERFRLEQELLDQSILDPLTGIHNRRYLEPRIEEMLAHYQRTGEGLALAMLDIDHFKQVNDNHGHLAGDRVLRHFAGLLQGQRRGTDVAARYGGEEFVIALADVTPDQACRALQRILELVREQPVCFEGEAVPVSVSAGLVHVTDLPWETLSSDALITEADRRLYKAKGSGRDCLVDASGPIRS
ncbi:sensor domain-containing diguanylate cyclase [Marinobacter sp. OP 3.4]|uniref:sensor domain-containing diguanylate cyclase n=1 Tax=Marinobacter sp. OP 3.4 TaxID=3076501 RepID=UPI002E1D544C